jgi:hypothetical protein
MSHAVVYNSELHIVESKLQGVMTVGEAREIIAKIAQIAKEKDCRFILLIFVRCHENYQSCRCTSCPTASGIYSTLLALTCCFTSGRMSWQEWQTELLQLSSNSQQLYAESGHNIHFEKPDAAIAAVLQMVEQVRESGTRWAV